MSRKFVTADLHLGHPNITLFRSGFTQEDHDERIFENLATTVNKGDTLYLLGDIAFSKYWLNRIRQLPCKYKLLICGNHDLERGISMQDLVDTYTSVKCLYSKKNIWYTHCPIHPSQFRGRYLNIHGHLHDQVIDDERYVNVSVEQTNYKPILIEDILKGKRNER